MRAAPESMYVVNGVAVIDVLPTKTLPPARDPAEEDVRECPISRARC